ncbi:hypothetical protein LOZ36_005608 [Ophidiomyces ophidiicola]|nr:hypothetical protein LOZ36_005608 [Ophidiomyces ophidiicola]
MFSHFILLFLSFTVYVFGNAIPATEELAVPAAGITWRSVPKKNQKIAILYRSPLFQKLMQEAVAKRQAQFTPDKRTEVTRLVDIIKTRHTISPNNPPIFDNGHATETTCDQERRHCGAKVTFFTRNSLTKVINVSVTPRPYTEMTRQNHLTTGTLKMQLVQSTARTVATSTGWKLGGKLTGTAKGIGIDLSAEYSQSTEKSETTTQQTWDTIDCPAKHECRFVTVTYSVTISGKCKARPRWTCGSQETYPCEGTPPQQSQTSSSISGKVKGRNHWWGTGVCEQFRNRALQCKKTLEVDCQGTFPLIGENGKAVSQIAAVAVPL